jgi:hypothetical protein
MDDIQWFSGPSAREHAGMTIRLTPSGGMSLGKAAYQALGSPEYVRLGWRQATGEIAIQRCDKASGGYHVGSKTRSIQASKFIHAHGLPRGITYDGTMAGDTLLCSRIDNTEGTSKWR